MCMCMFFLHFIYIIFMLNVYNTYDYILHILAFPKRNFPWDEKKINVKYNISFTIMVDKRSNKTMTKEADEII